MQHLLKITGVRRISPAFIKSLLLFSTGEKASLHDVDGEKVKLNVKNKELDKNFKNKIY